MPTLATVPVVMDPMDVQRAINSLESALAKIPDKNGEQYKQYKNMQRALLGWDFQRSMIDDLRFHISMITNELEFYKQQNAELRTELNRYQVIEEVNMHDILDLYLDKIKTMRKAGLFNTDKK